MGNEKAQRAKLFRALHAEGVKRGLDHDSVRDIVCAGTGHKSMSCVETQRLHDVMKGWTGHTVRRATPLPRRGCIAPGKPKQIVSGDDLNTLAAAFHKRGWDADTQRNFIRRQLGGRESIRTTQDFHRVFSGVRAMNRRDEK